MTDDDGTGLARLLDLSFRQHLYLPSHLIRYKSGYKEQYHLITPKCMCIYIHMYIYIYIYMYIHIYIYICSHPPSMTRADRACHGGDGA